MKYMRLKPIPKQTIWGTNEVGRYFGYADFPEDTGQAVQTLYEEIRSRDNQISLLRNENRQLEKRCHKLEELLRQIGTIVGEASDV